MKRFVTEHNLVVFLFAVVFVTFFFAENDSKKIEKLYAPEHAAKFEPVASPTVEAFITAPAEITSVE